MFAQGRIPSSHPLTTTTTAEEEAAESAAVDGGGCNIGGDGAATSHGTVQRPLAQPQPQLQQRTAAEARRREQHVKDREAIAALAVSTQMLGQHRAMRALNAMRLVVAESVFEQHTLGQKRHQQEADEQSRQTRPQSAQSRRLRTWQESFPVFFSVQNRVLVGRVVGGGDD